MSAHDPLVQSVQVNNKSSAAFGFVLAVAAALATCGVLQAKHPFFKVPSQFNIGMGAPIEARLALLAQQARVDRLNASVALTIGGALLSGALAIFAYSCCSLAMRLLIAIPWGAICGGTTGFVGVIAYSVIISKEALPDTTSIGLAQAAAFAILGTGIGLLFGAFSRNARKTAVSALTGGLAGAVGGIAFPVITGLVIPSQSTSDFEPAALIVRCLWLGLPFAAIGLALPLYCAWNGKGE